MQRKIGRFELIEELGSGAMGVVWRALDTRLRREVALKLIREERAADRTARERFVREFRAAAALNHPGIATLFEADETPEGRVYCVFEKVDGETLSERIRRGAAGAGECIEIGRQLSEALAAAHASGVVHRDIKPDNVMLTPEGRVKILDFGLAHLDHVASAPADDGETMDEPLRTRAGALVGTPRYMSPEQAVGAEVDARTDVFSAGLVLYELATGHAAFRGDSVPETLRQIQVEKHPPLKTAHRSIDRSLAGVVDRALSKSPAERYASGAEMALALRDAATPPARRGWLWAAAALLVMIGVAAGGLWFSNRPALAFSDRDKLLIADVDNRTGDEVFDLALTAAIENDIEQSRYARVYGRSQVSETLGMLRQPPDAVIDEKLGRDICRFAGLRAMVLPRILAAGEVYELQAVLVNPIDGTHVETLRVTAQGREEVLLTAVDELARNIRRSLGESLASIEETDLPIAQHTTSSWDALHSLSLADRRWQEARYPEAEALLERAIELDPEFMAAKGSLGLLKIQFLGQPEEGRALLREALELADDVSQVERMMIAAVNKEFVDADLEGALVDYETILDLYPDHLAAHINKGQIYFRTNRPPEAIAAFQAAHELEPSSAIPLWGLTRMQLFVVHDAAAADESTRKLAELLPESADALHFRAWALVAQRRFEEAEEAMSAVLAIDSQHGLALPNRAHLLMLLGRPDEAVPLYRSVLQRIERSGKGNVPWTTLCLALALRAAGDEGEALRMLDGPLSAWEESGVDGENRLEVAALLASAGDVPQATRIVDRLDTATVPTIWLTRLAEAYALTGRADEAIDVLERAVDEGFQDIYYWNIMPTLAALRDRPRFEALTESTD